MPVLKFYFSQKRKTMTIRTTFFCLVITAWIACAAGGDVGLAKEPPADPRMLLRPLPGLQADGAVLLPNQWSLRPTGKQVEVGNFPVNVALHPQGDWAAVLHSGYGPHEVAVVDLKTASVVSQGHPAEDILGLCFTPNGKQLLVSGGEDNVVYQLPLCRRKSLGSRGHRISQAPDGPGDHRPGVQPRRPMALCGLLPGQSAGDLPAAACRRSSNRSPCRTKAIPIPCLPRRRPLGCTSASGENRRWRWSICGGKDRGHLAHRLASHGNGPFA